MKNKVLLAITIVCVTFILVSFKPQTQQVPCGNAIADKINGIDVYVNSRPTRDYEVIKSGMNGITTNGEQVVSRSAKKAFDGDGKGNLTGDAVIVHLSNSRYEIIKYK